jgi:hypothetical protein
MERETAALCLVEKARSRKSKQARTEETIYGMDEDSQLWVRKPLIKDGVPVKDAELMLQNAGIPDEPKVLLSRKRIEEWLAKNGGNALRLSNKTRVDRVPVIADTESPTSLVPHRNAAGEVIGFKKATEGYLRYELWQAPDADKQGRPIYCRRLIPHPRGLAFLKKRGLHWKQKINGGKTLRQLVCGGALPRFSKRIAVFKKGDLLRVPLDSAGDISREEGRTCCWLWYRIESLKSNGQIQLGLAEFSTPEATPLRNLERDIRMQQPKSAAVLAYLVALQKQV